MGILKCECGGRWESVAHLNYGYIYVRMYRSVISVANVESHQLMKLCRNLIQTSLLHIMRAISSAGECFLDVEEVTGSIPVLPINNQ